jgi:RimJ/RimL family protein N-acetyltransferase
MGAVLPDAEPLATDGVVALRSYLLDDADAHFEGEDDDMVRWLSGGRSTRERTRRWMRRLVETPPFSTPRTALARSDVVSGIAGGFIEANLDLAGIAPGVANISYGVYPNFRGQGWAVRGINLMTQLLEGRARIAMIQIEPQNDRSISVAEGSDFSYVGRRVTPDGVEMLTFTKQLTETIDARAHPRD